MDDFGIGDGKLVSSRVQVPGSSRNKHFARRRRRVAHCVVEPRDRGAARGQHKPFIEHGIDVFGAALGGEPIAHTRPGGAQLRGDDLRHPSRVSLAALSLGNNRRNDVVLADREKSVELTRARRRVPRAGAADGELEGEKKGRCPDPLEESAPTRRCRRFGLCVDLFDVHGRTLIDVREHSRRRQSPRGFADKFRIGKDYRSSLS